jgi:hypothetical protein
MPSNVFFLKPKSREGGGKRGNIAETEGVGALFA